MEKKELKVRDLLKKYNLYSDEVQNINYHLNVHWCNAEYLVFKVMGLKNLTEQELAKVVYELILKCDANNPKYDSKTDEEMTRIGLQTDKFYGGHCHNPWENGMFEDDGFGFGSEPTTLYDDYIDSQTSSKSK